ncbi:Eco57I restriction-modification methylase domain-containing protein [Xylophilus sp.]|uniref:Eco57I restriction-modification methylase domain-containing protein n=1 Tax=Xylophilus sp. TaxID=2653893 RepID=UPI0013BB1F13|nr:Eco57I restriction-modification methylase domain-containing protein [Xylophilus sp.]KAF1045510.1 MAG: hypothetical protein GAK38_02959 [Xylophilus sp.]
MEEHVLSAPAAGPGRKKPRAKKASEDTHSLLERADQLRRGLSQTIDGRHKSTLGQFMTPAPVARFMAAMFPPGSSAGECRLLDAGAGLGALTCAFLDRWRAGGFGFARVEATACEVDDRLRDHLAASLSQYADPARLAIDVRGGDFILDAAAVFTDGRARRTHTHAILNPPYRKLGAKSAHRLALRQAGIETVNLYTAFVALAVELMAPGGLVVAIIPRSFCNGTYHRPFREHLLARCALRAVHLFHSRSQAFSDDEVLQENVIVLLERGGAQGPVAVTTSTDDRFADLAAAEHPFERIVFPDDAQRFIHVPTSAQATELEQAAGVQSSLADIGVQVSTGPVVDFRLKEHLRAQPGPGSAPLLYPQHFAGRRVAWPGGGAKKPLAIEVNEATRRWLMPAGFYCVVRRLSSKEEKRRVVAHGVRPGDFPPGTGLLGFENHVNVFHIQRGGLPEALAHGLAAYLNTTAVDEAFRRFSGHTQVNAGDLKAMRYPARDVLEAFGRWLIAYPDATQEELDARFRDSCP